MKVCILRIRLKNSMLKEARALSRINRISVTKLINRALIEKLQALRAENVRRKMPVLKKKGRRTEEELEASQRDEQNVNKRANAKKRKAA